MNDTLKVAGRIGAELGAAKAENEKLREVLRCIADLPMDRCSTENDYRLSAAKAIALGALSQQAEPTETYTAVDMATAAAQGFRDGQAAVEQASAQDEREAFKRALHSQRVFKLSSATINAAEWAWFHRPAQTEQQPVAVPEGWKLVPVQPTAEMLAAVTTSTFEPLRQEAMKMAREDYQAMLYAAPIAQTEQQPAYVECRECTDCGHVGINDAHPKDATCAMCDWSGPSPVEDQCPDCGKENAMGAACPKCSGRYRILAETHVAAPIAQTAQRGEA